MKKLTILTIAGLFLILFGQLTAQKSQPKSSPYLDDIIQTKMANAHIPGLSSCIVKEGQIRWIGAYGYAYIDEGIPVDTSTLFNLASISKTITVTALMQLWEQGLFGLDEDINDYLDFEVRIPNFPEDTITFRMLCTHTSSIEDNWDIMTYYWGEDSPIPLGEYLFNYLNSAGVNYDVELNFHNQAPGTIYDYCNTSTALIGYLVELIGDSTFSYQTQQNIFEPLAMNETAWFLSELDTMHIAMPYSWNGNNYIPYGHYGYSDYPAGQLRTSIDQIGNFLLCYMNGGTLLGQQVLGNETIDMVLTPQVPQINPGVGLIWHKVPYGGEIYYGHNGGDLGVKTTMYFRPEDNIGVIFLTNGESDFTDLGQLLFNYAADSMEVHCLPEGITFASQDEIDNFQTNYPYCTEIGGDVVINGDDITNLNGLNVLTTIEGGLIIISNPVLTSLSGLEGLGSIGGSLSIKWNDALVNLSSLNNLTFIGSFLNIEENNSLVSIEGLNNLGSIGVGPYGFGLSILTNENLTTISGLNSLTSIGGRLVIQNNYNLEIITGLQNIASIGGNLSMISNSSLTSLPDMDNLVSLGGNLNISGNAIEGLTGLNSLTNIGGNLEINDNWLLINLTGFDGLTFIEGNLSINNNDELTSLIGLENIEWESIVDLSITGNDSLSDCDIWNICQYLNYSGGTVVIENNATECNSIEEVEEHCLTEIKEYVSKEGLNINPNPLGSKVNITFNLKQSSFVTLKILDLSGKEMSVLINEIQKQGEQKVIYNSRGLKPGIYFCVLKTNDGMQTKKLIKME